MDFLTPLSYYTNIWPLGAIMYELVTLVRVDDNWSHISGTPAINTQRDPEYSSKLLDLIEQCLEIDPEDRPSLTELRRKTLKYAHITSNALSADGFDPTDRDRLYFRGTEIDDLEFGERYFTPSLEPDEMDFNTETSPGFQAPIDIPSRTDENSAPAYDFDQAEAQRIARGEESFSNDSLPSDLMEELLGENYEDDEEEDDVDMVDVGVPPLVPPQPQPPSPPRRRRQRSSESSEQRWTDRRAKRPRLWA